MVQYTWRETKQHKASNILIYLLFLSDAFLVKTVVSARPKRWPQIQDIPIQLRHSFHLFVGCKLHVSDTGS